MTDETSLRETWPPGTVAMKVDEGAPPADAPEGGLPVSPPAAPLVPPRSRYHDFAPRPPAVPLVPPHEVYRDAELALEAARHELRQATDTLATARHNVSTALANYNRVTPVITAEENTRQWIAANNAARAERAARRYIPTVTETARAMGGGGHGPANEIRTSRGGGAAYRRGPGGVQAYTKNQAQTANAIRLRAAKLPSER